jgi:23S rRNA-/tRNA-specific pseudouridylate synthase
VGLDYLVQNGDKILHKLIRNETPVLNHPIQTIKEDDELLIVDKPSSIPVHPCGNFKFNSLIEIIKRQRQDGNEENKREDKEQLRTIHRLDRQTSGILFMAKTEAAAEKFRILFEENKMKKTYYAKVKGKFPEEKLTCDNPVFCLSSKDCFYGSKPEAELTPVEKETAKSASTTFELQFYS